MNGPLRGVKGAREVEVDALGRELQLVQERDPGPGMNLVLSIDLELQQLVEGELSWSSRFYRGDGPTQW